MLAAAGAPVSADPPVKAPAEEPGTALRLTPAVSTLRLRMGLIPHVYLYKPTAPTRPGTHAVVFFAGDWGWRPLQQESASRLASEGRFVLGIDSTEYFVRALEPDGWVEDLKRLREFANEKAGLPAATPIILMGFTWGAEQIPYMLNRGGAAGIAGTVLIGPDTESAFIYRVTLEMKGVPSPPNESFQVTPEIRAMPPVPTVLMEGALDDRSAAKTFDPLLKGPHRLVTIPGGDRQFREVRDIYLDRLSQAATWLDDPAAQKAPPPPAPSPSPAPS
jgi:type IV secretory pathway VirJ component